MNHTRTTQHLANRWTTIGILIFSTTSLWAGDPTPGTKCEDSCKIEGYRNKVIINLIDTPGQKPYASPACACVRPGGTVIWRNEDPEVPWTVVFSTSNPIDTPGKISDFDDTWFILDSTAMTDYHYTAKLGGVDVDPHVVVGDHPPVETNKKTKGTKPQR
jgi:hypothetical protein